MKKDEDGDGDDNIIVAGDFQMKENRPPMHDLLIVNAHTSILVTCHSLSNVVFSSLSFEPFRLSPNMQS